MPAGTPYIPESVPFIANGVTQQLTPTQMNTAFGPSNVKTSTATFSLISNGHLVNFVKGVPRACDAALLAALIAHNCPVA